MVCIIIFDDLFKFDYEKHCLNWKCLLLCRWNFQISSCQTRYGNKPIPVAPNNHAITCACYPDLVMMTRFMN
jgi:hypothetical protein